MNLPALFCEAGKSSIGQTTPQRSYELSFTILFSALSFLALIGVSYARKGLKTALMATGIAFVLIALLLAGLVFVIVNSMPN